MTIPHRPLLVILGVGENWQINLSGPETEYGETELQEVAMPENDGMNYCRRRKNRKNRKYREYRIR
ncbi:MAG: hypothetical protein O2971_08725 [Proteobacteria bacterium]|nr:hypothetical protein [Pseudomonadota bacterium]